MPSEFTSEPALTLTDQECDLHLRVTFMDGVPVGVSISDRRRPDAIVSLPIDFWERCAPAAAHVIDMHRTDGK